MEQNYPETNQVDELLNNRSNRVAFEDPIGGKHFTVSPDGKLAAVVVHSVVLRIFKTDEEEEAGANRGNNNGGISGLHQSSPSPLERGAALRDSTNKEHNTTSARHHDSAAQKIPPKKKTIGAKTEIPTLAGQRYTALDEITDLRWSPCSSAVAVSMGHRSAVEVIRVSDVAIIARVDGSVNDLVACRWTKDGQSILWFGQSKSFALRVRDSALVELEDRIVVHQPPMAAAYPTVVAASLEAEHKRASGGSTDGAGMDNIGNADTSSGNNRVHLNLAQVEKPEPMLFFSHCGEYCYSVSSPLPPHQKESPGDLLTVRQASSLKVLARIPVWTLGLPALTNNLESGGGAAGGVKPIIRTVSTFLVASNVIVILDRESGNVVFLSPKPMRSQLPNQQANGGVDHNSPLRVAVTLPPIMKPSVGKGIDAVSISKDSGRTISLLSAGEGGSPSSPSTSCSLYLFICVRGKYFEISSLPLKPSFQAPSTPLLLETTTSRKEAAPPQLNPPPSAMRYLQTPQDLISTHYEVSIDWPLSVFASLKLEAVTQGSMMDTIIQAERSLSLLSVSPSGRWVAAVQAEYPSTVFMIDVLQAQVHSILGHKRIVTHLWWSGGHHSSPVIEGGNEDHHNTSADDATGDQEALAVMTDNHDGNVFYWRAEEAMTITVPNILSSPPENATTVGGGRNSAADSHHDPIFQEKAITRFLEREQNRQLRSGEEERLSVADRPCACDGNSSKANQEGEHIIRGTPVGFKCDGLVWKTSSGHQAADGGAGGGGCYLLDPLRGLCVRANFLPVSEQN